jgi:YbbR domain-containing protein
MKRMQEKLQLLLHYVAETSVMSAIIVFSKKHKIVARVTCLVLAVLFWAYVDNKRISEVRFRIPVQVDLAKDLAVAEIEKRYILVAARGSGEELRNVNQNNISVFVKIQNPTVGETSKYPVSVRTKEISDAISLVPEDKTLFAMIEKRKVKKIHIEVKTEGSLDSRFLLGNKKVTPDEVEISGAESVIDKIHFVETEPVSLSGHAETFSQSVKLNISEARFLDVYQKFFTVELPVYNTKDISQVIVALTMKGAADIADYESVQKNVRIFVKSEKENESLSPDDFDAWVNLPDAVSRPKDSDQNFLVVPTMIRMKVNHSLVAVIPDKIQIRIRKK